MVILIAFGKATQLNSDSVKSDTISAKCLSQHLSAGAGRGETFPVGYDYGYAVQCTLSMENQLLVMSTDVRPNNCRC